MTCFEPSPSRANILPGSAPTCIIFASKRGSSKVQESKGPRLRGAEVPRIEGFKGAEFKSSRVQGQNERRSRVQRSKGPESPRGQGERKDESRRSTLNKESKEEQEEQRETTRSRMKEPEGEKKKRRKRSRRKKQKVFFRPTPSRLSPGRLTCSMQRKLNFQINMQGRLLHEGRKSELVQIWGRFRLNLD